MFGSRDSIGVCWKDSFETSKMDLKNKMPIFIFLILHINQVSGTSVSPPEKLEVIISDGEVTMFWEAPLDASSDLVYNVQMAKYTDEWAEITSCTKITETFCHLTSLIQDYSTCYKVRVQLATGDKHSTWIQKKFYPNQSQLLPPFFSLWATSSTLTVHVHEKPILKKLFPFGVTYTIYLEERDNKTTTVYLEDDGGEDQRTKTLTGLHWRRKYCISIKVEAKGGLSASDVSDKQCVLLPEREFFVIAVSSLSILGCLSMVAIISSVLLCYLRCPAKTPAALKSPVSGWRPLSVSEGIMEVVTDKGWFLSSYRTEMDNAPKLPESHDVTAHSKEENRKTSVDSGFSLEADSATENGETPPVGQEDSGCGSMGRPERSSDNQIGYPTQEKRMDTDGITKGEDSGVDMSCQLDSSSLNLEGKDGEPLVKTVIVGNYHSQGLSEVHIQVGDGEDAFKQIPAHLILDDVLSGYRAGPRSCICSGAGQCSWCHKYGHFGSEVTKQHRAVCIENGLLGSKSDLNSYKRKETCPPYSSKTHMDAVTMEDLDTTFFHMGETFPLLTSLALTKCEQDFSMNNVSLSLCDVELMTD